MKVTIEINCDGAAFDPRTWDDERGNELSRILADLAGEMERSGLIPERPLRDINGNKCGTVTVRK